MPKTATTRPTRARRPLATRPEPRPAPEPPPPVPVQVVPDELVESVMLRLDHAVRWGNWDMADRVLADAKRQTHEIAHEAVRPLEERPVECLHELAGLPEALIRPLRIVNDFARRPVTVGELLDFGRARLATHDAYQGNRASMVWGAIRIARRQIERQIQDLTCWRIVC